MCASSKAAGNSTLPELVDSMNPLHNVAVEACDEGKLETTLTP